VSKGQELGVEVTYSVDVDGKTVVIALQSVGAVEGAGEREVGLVQVDGETVSAALLEVPDSPIRVLRLGNRVYELVPERGERRGSYTIALAGHRVSAEALDERTRAVRAIKRVSAAPPGPEALKAPMPGLVSRVLVSQGDAVGAGDGLIVIEAMKMENELRAKSAGRVRSVRVTPGTAVEKGAVLIELERADNRPATDA
jgi:biotin carboxyl carrier protein